MRTSYSPQDVTVLLKDVTGMIAPLDTYEREQKIQSGMHYSQMLPMEYKPSHAYLDLYHQSLTLYAQTTADAVATVAEKVFLRKGKDVVLVSLARAGTPIGILMKRYLHHKYGIDVPHYAISIIRGRGIDHNALVYILQRHTPAQIQFVDGWIGKGAITTELTKEMQNYPKVDATLAVLSDPSGLTPLCGTREDFLIPSSCLNATVSGLMSRTILNSELIGKEDFHGAVYYPELAAEDVSNAFLAKVEALMDYSRMVSTQEQERTPNGLEQAASIAKEFDVQDINFVKPGIGETTRVLLRRVPWKILVKDKNDLHHIGHILKLCEEKQVEVQEYPLISYRACGIIKNLMADV